MSSSGAARPQAAGGQQADGHGGPAHAEQGQHQHQFAAVAVAQPARQDGAQGPEEEADADGRKRDQLGQRGVLGRQRVKVEGGEHKACRLGVDEEVVPLDGGAHEGPGQDLLLFTGLLVALGAEVSLLAHVACVPLVSVRVMRGRAQAATS